jgi:hypothetical protein
MILIGILCNQVIGIIKLYFFRSLDREADHFLLKPIKLPVTTKGI